MKQLGTIEPEPAIGTVFDLRWDAKSWRDDAPGEYVLDTKKVVAKTARTVIFEVFNEWRKCYERKRVVREPSEFCWNADEAFEKERLKISADIEYHKRVTAGLENRLKCLMARKWEAPDA